MHPPSPIPSKNWWKLRAPTRGLMVEELSDAPKEMPIITECTRMPSSNTYKNPILTYCIGATNLTIE